MQTDFLIIGQGLAGSLLAWELMQRGYSVIVIDNGESNASKVAAGIINPVSGIRLALADDAERLLAAALAFYSQVSDFFGQAFYHELPMLRLFRNEAERAFGLKRLRQLNYQDYLALPEQPQFLDNDISAPLGWLKQKHTGYLSVAPLLERLKQFFIENQSYRQEKIYYQDIDLTSATKSPGIKAKRIIFCEGYQAASNPWFKWLPMQPAKGEMLTITTEITLPNAILNYGNWVLPGQQNTARIGATFDREFSDNLPTEQGKRTLLMNLQAFSPHLSQAKILTHQVGIRPCTADRFPFIGKHPIHDNALIFNGFGSKGSLQIPWYCQRFADYLQHHKPLPAACDIQRFHASHFPG